MILGIDLCKKYAQVSFYNKKEATIETPFLIKCDNVCNVPVSICKKKGVDEWCIGDEQLRLSLLSEGVLVENLIEKLYSGENVFVDGINVQPRELIEKFFEELVKLVADNKPLEGVAVSCDEYNVVLLDCLKEAFGKLGVNSDKVELLNRQESMMYYVLSQKKEIWYGDVVVFDYAQDGLAASILSIKRNGNREQVHIEDYDLRKELPYFPITTDEQKNAVSSKLTEISEKLFERRVISSVFLTGKGFDYDFQFDEFIKYICNKRRVFAGQNIYSKGACYCAMDIVNPGAFENRTLMCKDKLMYELALEITERGKDSRLVIARPGTNWYKARKKYDFYIEGSQEIVFHKKNEGDVIGDRIVISLEEFPMRPNKATKIGIGFDFNSEGKCRITIKDRGLGNFYKASGKMICREI